MTIDVSSYLIVRHMTRKKQFRFHYSDTLEEYDFVVDSYHGKTMRFGKSGREISKVNILISEGQLEVLY